VLAQVDAEMTGGRGDSDCAVSPVRNRYEWRIQNANDFWCAIIGTIDAYLANTILQQCRECRAGGSSTGDAFDQSLTFEPVRDGPFDLIRKRLIATQQHARDTYVRRKSVDELA
jgi:hypothetical protein